MGLKVTNSSLGFEIISKEALSYWTIGVNRGFFGGSI